jgi:hypothetical protein
MERVREIGADVPGLPDAGLGAARSALLREIAREGRMDAAPWRRRTVRWIGGSALAGGLAAAALVVGVVVVPATAPTASAAQVLEQAAEATLTTTALSPGPGQYIRIQEIEKLRIGWNVSPDQPKGWWSPGRSDTEATLLLSRSLYVPADRSGTWVREFSESEEAVDLTGPDADTASRDFSDIGASNSVEVYPGGMYSQTGVGAEGVEPDDVLTFAVNGLSCYYDEMPRDPQALVKWIDDYDHTYLSDCPPPRLTEPTDFNLAPSDLRAAMFRALALLDGARVVATNGDVTTIAVPEGGESTRMETVDIDTTTGLMVGRGALDDDTWSSRIVVSIIDAIPSSVVLPSP